MNAYSLIFKKSHYTRVTILAENEDAAEHRARELVDKFCIGDKEGAALEFLWLEVAKANQPFVIGGKEYMTDSETIKVLENMFPARGAAALTSSQRNSWNQQMKLILLGQNLGRIILFDEKRTE